VKLVFFDFNANFGGAPQGSVSLVKRLNECNEVFVIDAYGRCNEYCDAIRNSGINLSVLCPNVNRTVIGYHGIVRLAVGLSQLHNFIRLTFRLHRILKKIGPDVVWVNNYKSLFFLYIPWLKFRYPTFVYIRGWATRDQMSKMFLFLLKYKVRHIIAHSHASIAQLVKLRIPEDKITYVPNAVDINSDTAVIIPATYLPHKDNKLVILLPAARPEYLKGHLCAVKALKLIRDKGIEAVLWFPGRVATGVDNSFIETLNVLIKKLNLEEHVFFIGWRNDMPNVIRAADIVILPSHTEGFPRVVIESMLLQRIVIATPVGGTPEAVFDGKTGFIMEIENDQQLAEKIKYIIDNPDICKTIISRAFVFAKKTFSPKIQTQLIQQKFQAFKE